MVRVPLSRPRRIGLSGCWAIRVARRKRLSVPGPRDSGAGDDEPSAAGAHRSTVLADVEHPSQIGAGVESIRANARRADAERASSLTRENEGDVRAQRYGGG